MSLLNRIAIFAGMLFVLAAIAIGTIVLFNTIGEMIPAIVNGLTR